MTHTIPRKWTCPVCGQAPTVHFEVICPACGLKIAEDVGIYFEPRTFNAVSHEALDAGNHEAHLIAAQRFIKDFQWDHQSYDMNGFRVDIPEFFKEHIKRHEERAFKHGAASRDSDIRRRLEELNGKADSFIAGLTVEILMKRQQECTHTHEKRWLQTNEPGRMNLHCLGCFKVLEVKFVGTLMQQGETIGLRIVAEK